MFIIINGTSFVNGSAPYLVLGELGIVEFGVGAVFFEEGSVGALFDNVAVFDDENQVCILNSRETMSNNEAGAAFGEFIHSFLNNHFGARIDGRGSFVQDE